MFLRKVLVIAAALLPASLIADQITLSNGDRISGQVIKKDGDKLTVKSALFGEVSIPWSAVTSIRTDEPVVVVLSGGKSVSGKLDTADNKVQIVTSAGPEATALADITALRNSDEQGKYEKLLHPGILELWTGFVDLGLALARGNARTTTFTTAFNTARTSRTGTIKLYMNDIYATARVNGKPAATAQAIRGGWSYGRNIGPRLLANVFNDYENDKFQDLDLRFVLGGGLGFHVIKNNRSVLDLLGGIDYNREHFTKLTRKSAEAYTGDDWTYKLSSASSLTQSFRFFPNLSNTGNYRINFDLGAVTAFKKWLSWQVTASDRYLSNPVFGHQRNDVLLTTGFRLSFAR